MHKYRQTLQDTLLQDANKMRSEAKRARRFYDALETAALVAFAAGYALAVIVHLS